MRTLKLTIEYDGTNYCGWQSQKNDPTVQDTVEAKLERILNHSVRVHGSGRTDSGVHATGQVAHVTTRSTIDSAVLQRGANSLLPPDIFIREIQPVDEDFHARFSAKSRRYEYCIWNSPLPNIFRRNYVWWLRDELSVDRMDAASRKLLGGHDFSAFQGADAKKVFPERNVLEAGFRKEGPKVVFFIHANGFLRHMVRNIVGTLVEVGTMKITVDDFEKILESRNRGQAGITAPAQGLFLTEVLY